MSSKDLTQLTVWDWAMIWIKATFGLAIAQALIVTLAGAALVPMMFIAKLIGG